MPESPSRAQVSCVLALKPDDARNAIVRALKTFKAGYLTAVFEDANPMAGATFLDPLHRMDVFYYSHDPLWGKSKVYKDKNCFMDYYVNFQVHLIGIDASRTRLEIVSIDPKVPGKSSFNWHTFGFSQGLEPVKATVDEELELLHYIQSQVTENKERGS